MATEFEPNAGICTVPNCGNPRSNITDYCSKHATHNSRWGHPTRRCFSLKKGEGVLKIDWCERYILDRIDTDEDIAIGIEWLQCYFSEKAKKAGRVQKFAKRVYEQTAHQDYSRILAAMSAYLAEHIALPNTLPNDRMLECAIGTAALFATTSATSESKRKKTGGHSATSYYAPRWVIKDVFNDLMQNLLPVANKVATRSVKLSPFYERKDMK